jgi:SNF2 family DNA or RNA helicase
MPAPELALYKASTEGLRYDPKIKQHVATLDKLPIILRRLREANFAVTVIPEVVELLEKHEACLWLDLQTAKDRIEILAKEMAKKGKALYPYQRTGVEWLTVRHRALLGDEMGLGKSVEALCAIPPNAPVLVICPAIGKGVWIGETMQWRPTLSPQSLEGRTSFRFPRPGEMVITNFDILPNCHLPRCSKKVVVKCDGCSPLIPEGHLSTCKRGITYCPGCAPLPVPHEGTVMIVDECHAAKNRHSLRGERIRALGGLVRAKGGRTWFLSGTPMLNEPEELWSLLESCDLAHEAFGSWRDFVKCFGGKVKLTKIYDKRARKTVERQIGYEWGTPSADTPERLQRVMLRRMQVDVVKDMPEMTVRLLPVDVSKEAVREFDSLFKKLGGSKNLTDALALKKIPFAMVSTVRSALARAKIPAMLQYVEEYESNAEPLIVFSAHRDPIDLFLDREGWAVITGDTPSKERTEIAEAFQQGKYRGLAGTIEAAGVAITLTYACHELFVDEEWTPGLNDQARRRVLRHGQKRSVSIDILVANHPLDRRVAEILSGKRTLIGSTIDAARETA